MGIERLAGRRGIASTEPNTIPRVDDRADDSHILFTSFRSDPDLGLVPDIWQIPLPSGNPTLVVENASSASTSPDGRQLVYAAVTPGGTAIRIRNLDGSEIEIAAHGFWPRWSPDGRWIAFTTSDPEGGEGTRHVGGAKRGRLRRQAGHRFRPLHL